MKTVDFPERINKLLINFNKPWCVAGGWGIDLFLGENTREHKDIEVAIFRHDQLSLQKYLSHWQLKKCIPGSKIMENWIENEYLEPPVHEIHAYNDITEEKEFEILLNECIGAKWIYRRNKEIHLDVDKFMISKKEGIPFIHPMLNILYRSKYTNKNDQHDFDLVMTKLSNEEKSWLYSSIKKDMPEHKWLIKLN